MLKKSLILATAVATLSLFPAFAQDDANAIMRFPLSSPLLMGTVPPTQQCMSWDPVTKAETGMVSHPADQDCPSEPVIALVVGAEVTVPATVGQAVDFTLPVSGGRGIYSYVHSGTTAPGTNSSGGKITGTPTASGDYPVSITVSDASVPPQQVPRTITLAVVAPVTITTQPSAVTVAPGNSISTGIVASGGAGPLTYTSLATLPVGMTVNPATGAIEATATTIQNTYQVWMVVADTANRSVTSSPFVVTVKSPPSGATAATTLPTGVTVANLHLTSYVASNLIRAFYDMDAATPAATYNATAGAGHKWFSVAYPTQGIWANGCAWAVNMPVTGKIKIRYLNDQYPAWSPFHEVNLGVGSNGNAADPCGFGGDVLMRQVQILLETPTAGGATLTEFRLTYDGNSPAAP